MASPGLKATRLIQSTGEVVRREIYEINLRGSRKPARWNDMIVVNSRPLSAHNVAIFSVSVVSVVQKLQSTSKSGQQ